jgi:molybdopterin synthase catalytic subunit
VLPPVADRTLASKGRLVGKTLLKHFLLPDYRTLVQRKITSEHRGIAMGTKSVSLDDLVAGLKARPEITRAGMILCHNGIVREFDRSRAKRVRALKVEVDAAAIGQIRTWAESQPGIVGVAIAALEGEFHVGDDLLYVVVAGDFRENVFAVTREIVERIKSGGVHKTEIYED